MEFFNISLSSINNLTLNKDLPEWAQYSVRIKSQSTGHLTKERPEKVQKALHTRIDHFSKVHLILPYCKHKWLCNGAGSTDQITNTSQILADKVYTQKYCQKRARTSLGVTETANHWSVGISGGIWAADVCLALTD